MSDSDIIRTIINAGAYGAIAAYLLRMVDRLIKRLLDELIPVLKAEAAAMAKLSEKIDALTKKDKDT